MTTTEKKKPTHRLSFARIVGTDQYGKEKLGNAREIATVWPMKSGKSSIVRLDIIPIELTQHQGVLFLTPITSDDTPSSSEDLSNEAGYAP